MKSGRTFKFVLGMLLTFSIVTAGCGNGEKESETGKNTNQPAVAIKTDPANLKMLTPPWLTDEEIASYITEPLAKKYPHITVETLRGNEQELLASGVEIDMIVVSSANMDRYKNLDFFDNLDPVLKKHSFDLNRFKPVVIESLRNLSDSAQLHAIAYADNYRATYYNKDLFDKFGVPYPKDGMTWDEAIEIARKLTRVEDGVQYKGMQIDFLFPSHQLGAQFADAKTKKATMQTDAWRKVFELGKAVNDLQQKPDNANAQKSFVELKTQAMWPNWNASNVMGEAQKQGLNWDMVQYPSFKEKPNVSHMNDTHVVLITKTSKYKDQAVQVLEVFTSDEVQLLMARNGKLPVLKNPELEKEFGKNQDFMAGKNVQSIFKSTVLPAKPSIVTPFDGRRNINPSYVEYINGQKDVNTALREADEKINQFIQTELNK